MPDNDAPKHFGSHFASPDETPSRPAWGTDTPDIIEPGAAPAIPNADEVAYDALGESTTPDAVSESTAAALDMLAPGQGAMVTTRDTAAEAADAARSTFQEMGTDSLRLTGVNRPQVNSKRGGGRLSGMFVGVVVVVAALLVAAGLFIARNILHPSGPDGGEGGLVDQTQVELSEPIEYGGYTYQVDELPDGTYQLTRLAAGATEPLVISELAGKPIALILSNGTFFIPENLGDSWDVIAYTMGDGSVPTKLVGQDGNEVSGSGSLVSASLSGDTLMLESETDGQQTVALA